MSELCHDTGSSRTLAVGRSEKSWEGGEHIEGAVTSPTEGEIKESVTYFYLSFLQRKAFILFGVSKLRVVTQELRDGPLSVVRCVLFV